MNDESSDAFKIRRAPNGQYYVWGNGEVICVPNGSLRYFGTEHDARVFPSAVGPKSAKSPN